MNKLTEAFRSFYLAGRGIAFCLRHERHFRIHLIATVYVMFFSLFYSFDRTDYAILILTCAAVISMEIVNTSVEVVIDKVSPQYNVYAMIGKDIAAGAVLFTTIGAIAVGIFMFWDIETIAKIIGFFTSDPVRLALLLVSFALSVWFIMKAKPRKLGNKRKGNINND
jgi:diacylglycerol kinase